MLRNKKLTIAIIGLGYVGLPLLQTLAKKNFKILGFDTNLKLIKDLKKNKSHIDDISKNELLDLKKLNVDFTHDYKKLDKCDVYIICVPTPILKDKSPDNQYLNSVAKLLNKTNLKNKLIINESTTYPGATREIFGKIFLDQNLTIGKNCYLGFSPERIDPGNKKFKAINIPKIISGATNNCLKQVCLIYEKVFSTHKVSKIETAEFTKIYENIFRSINISFVNEMKVLSHKMNIDIYEVIRGASTKPFGFLPFYPGPGFGGHCIPVDPYLLSWKAKEFNFFTRFIELSGQINETMPNYIVKNLVTHLIINKKKFSKIQILIIGLSYKKNSRDIRETPATKVVQLLKKYNFEIFYNDELIDKKDLKKNLTLKNLKSKKINLKNINKFDACLILTDHDYVNYKFIRENTKLVFDTRGRYTKKFKNVIQL